jgi:hypothetical protein
LADGKSENDPVACAEAFAAQHRGPDLPLDFSLASLRSDVDRLLLLPMFHHGRDGLATAAEERAEAALCAYVGESARRLFDGEWVGEFDPAVPINNFYRSRVRFGTFHFNPHIQVAYRLTNGPEEGTLGEHLDHVLPNIMARDGEPDPRCP